LENLTVKHANEKIQKRNTEIEKEREGKAKTTCPVCGSENCYGMSRVVGYFSIIENWNRSKQAEFSKRQKGDYWFLEE